MEVKERTFYPLGMFDLVKGLGMIGIVLAHATAMLDISKWIYYPIHILSGGIMGTYYAINGFQFKPSISVKQSIKKHIKAYLSLYFRLAIAILLGLLIVNPGDMFQQVLGFLLGLLSGMQIGSYYASSVLMGWFFLALFWGSILLELLLKIRRESVRVACIVVFTLVGIYLESVSFFYFCICRGFQALPSMYIGYCIYSKNLLSQRKKRIRRGTPYLLYVVSLPIIYAYIVGSPGFMNTFLLVFAETIWAYTTIFVSRDTEGCTSGLVDIICKVGRYTPWIIIVHCMEHICFPWNIYFETFFPNASVKPDICFLLFFISRCIVIFLGCMLMVRIDRIEKNWKRKRRSKKRAQSRMVG